MFRILMLFFGLLLFSFYGHAQIDSLAVEFEYTELLNPPFSLEEINSMELKSKIIVDQNHSKFTSYFFLVLLNLLLIAVLLIQYSKPNVNKMISTLFNINKLKQYANSEMKRDNNFLIAYFLLVNIFVVLFIYLVSERFFLELDVLIMGLYLVVFFIVELLVNRLTAYILKTKETYSSIVFNNATFLVLALPFIIVSVLLISYLPETMINGFLYGFIFLIGLLLLLKETRNIIILSSNKIKVNSFYFFLYLCTFKLIPLMLLVKVLMVEILK